MTVDRKIVCDRIVFVDSEFDARKGRGEPPGPPVCICAVEIDRQGRATEHRLATPYPAQPPWTRDDPFLTIGYALSAEAGSFLHAGWKFPAPALDLYAEYMVLHNSEMVHKAKGDSKPPGPTLLAACARYRVGTMDAGHKDDMRSLAYTKTNHTSEEIVLLQDYCVEDCRMTMRLFKAMLPRLDLVRSPIRAAFMMEIEQIRWHGIPIDISTYRRAEQRAQTTVTRMREEMNRRLDAEVYDGGVFKRKTVFKVMHAHGISIPTNPKTGKYSCATRQIKSMVETYPLMKVFYEFKRMIDALGDLKLEIGADDRNRFWLNPFGTKTGRNNPSTNRCVLGLPHTMRSFIKPPPGMALALVDYGAQEVGIAAALSGDPVMQADYRSGDPYRQFAAAALGILKPTAQQRQVYKATVLGRIYGLGVGSLARDLGLTRAQAQFVYDQMTARYVELGKWLKRIDTKAAHGVPITCALGWSLSSRGHPGEDRTFKNFPMQANAAEMMRLVIVRAGQAGLRIVGCAHDSFIIENTIAEIEAPIAALQDIMRQTSRDLLNGFELRADCNPDRDIVRYPARYIDKRELENDMRHWDWLMELITGGEEEAA